MQCQQKTVFSGRQCTQRVRFGYLCEKHTMLRYGVAIRKSNIMNAGLGLFATRAFPEDALIVPYMGEKIDQKTFDERYMHNGNNPEYVVYDDFHHLYLDAHSMTSSIARFANAADAPTGKQIPNAALDLNDDGEVCLYTIRRLSEGAEILWDYGGDYHWGPISI